MFKGKLALLTDSTHAWLESLNAHIVTVLRAKVVVLSFINKVPALGGGGLGQRW